jgi:hypothetical protein
MLAQLVVSKVSTAEANFFSSSTVHAPLAVAEAFLDTLRHLLLHWFSLRPGTFAASLTQLEVPKVSTT